jgi:arylsulfatase A-like enzyme
VPKAGQGAKATDSTVRNVVLISVDTLRADRLGLYGDKRGTSLNLDSVGKASVVFERALAQASQTAPSHASAFTSLPPGVHGIYNVHGDDTLTPVLPAGVRTLAEQVSAAGIDTAAFVSGGNLTKAMGMNRGFRLWDERNEDVAARVDAFLKWLSAKGDGRFLGLVHTYQVHAPYVPPADVAPRFVSASYSGALRATYERYLAMSSAEAFMRGAGPDYWGPDMLNYTEEDVAYLSDLYDAEICYADSQLRRIFETLLKGPRRDDTAIIVFSDHGEEFREHGKFQHDQAYQELLHVPLVVYAGAALEKQGWKGRVQTPVELMDLPPTVCELLGVALPGDVWAGRSLVPMMRPDTREAARRDERPVFAEFKRDHGKHLYRAVAWHDWKYIIHRQLDTGRVWEHLFDLAKDPGEQQNLIDSTQDPAPTNLRRLRELLGQLDLRQESLSGRVGVPGSEPTSDETRRMVESLGYTGTKPSAAASGASRSTYVVQAGDTLRQIALRELGSEDLASELMRLNGLPDAGAIREGQVLKLR